MTNYFDDDDAFWAPQDPGGRAGGSGFEEWELDDPDATQQIARVRPLQPERTRSHHVVQRDPRMQSLHDDDDMLWLEPECRRPAGAGFSGVDPRALSLGAITLAAVLAVPLFGALTNGDGNGGSDALRAVAVAQASTTTIAATTLAPTTALAVTADLSAPAPTHADVSGVRSGSSSYSADASAGASACPARGRTRRFRRRPNHRPRHAPTSTPPWPATTGFASPTQWTCR